MLLNLLRPREVERVARRMGTVRQGIMFSNLAAMESFCFSTIPDVVKDVVGFEHVKVGEDVKALKRRQTRQRCVKTTRQK